MARQIGSVRTTSNHGRVHQRLGEYARRAARVVDARLNLFEPSDWLRWFETDPSADPQEIEILKRGDRDQVAQRMSKELAQRVSDQQPHAKSLNALADAIEAGDDVVVQPWRVIEVLAQAQGIDSARVGDLETLDNAPPWLLNLVRTLRAEDDYRPGVCVYADDSISIDTLGRPSAW